MVYREFCANQDAALVRLDRLCEENPELSTFLHYCERKMRVQAMPLSSYFLKPMQRITKYKLLIDKVSYGSSVGALSSLSLRFPILH